jgi:DNA mismatch repair protein MutS2
LTLNQIGEVLSLPDNKGDLTVKIGIMKANINISDLMFIEKETTKTPKAKSSYGSLYNAKSRQVAISINVQGKYLEDALIDVEKYLDDAYMAGLHEVTVIHGRGEGILKDGIRQTLKSNRNIASFRKGGYNEGGDGVTIVTFKE